jgi:hypothetical protein
MGLSGQYREHAAECLRSAQAAKTPASKALYLTMAEVWVRLADQGESITGKSGARVTPNPQPAQPTVTNTTH